MLDKRMYSMHCTGLEQTCPASSFMVMTGMKKKIYTYKRMYSMHCTGRHHHDRRCGTSLFHLRLSTTFRS